MNEIAIVKKEIMEKEWAEKIQCCRESGLTVSEWCRENNINLKTYYYHLRKIRKKLCEQIAVPVMTVEDTNPTVKLRIADVTAEITDSTSEQTFCCWKEELVVLKHAERCEGKCADLFSYCYCLC